MLANSISDGGNIPAAREFQVQDSTQVGRNFCAFFPNDERFPASLSSGEIPGLVDRIVPGEQIPLCFLLRVYHQP